MIESVKVMIDEQSRLTLKQFEETLGELLAPLKRLEEVGTAANGPEQGESAVNESLRSVKASLEDAFDDLARKVDALANAQNEVFSKVAAVARAQAETNARLDSILEALSVQKAKTAAPKKPTKKSTKKSAAKKSVASK